MRPFLATLLFLAGLLPVAEAASGLPAGTYRCWSYNVSGGAGSCRLARPLVIHADGTYEESSTRGTYKVSGDRVVFSEAKIRGTGKISDGNKISFEYDYSGRHHTVTYLCQECATTGR